MVSQTAIWVASTLLHAFLISNTFISNTKLILAKKKAQAKHHSDAELLPFEDCSLSSCMLSSKNNWTYSKKCEKKPNKE